MRKWEGTGTLMSQLKEKVKGGKETHVFTFLYRSERFRETYKHKVKLQFVMFAVLSVN